ncbi:hypothetical protein ACFL1N_03245 [Thermodesulfobacteriota bacterium]
MLYKRLCKLFFTVTLLLYPIGVFAENIDPDNDGHQYAYGENTGWINFKPNEEQGVTVMDSSLSGYAWGENIGWIKMDPDQGGVSNDGLGNLSGYAWGENIGWISFSCEDRGTCTTVDYGVTIDPYSGVFSGFAWAENMGWISFNSTSVVPFKITTSWRLDSDDDGFSDEEDAFPDDPNEWLDTDGDGIGNNEDLDDDNDGMPDVWEELYGLDPHVNDANEDPDNDGYKNIQEYIENGDPHNSGEPFPWELFYPAFIKKSLDGNGS